MNTKEVQSELKIRVMTYEEQRFKEKYKDQEVELPRPLLVIRDDHPSPFSSGSNGYIKKLRARNGKLEYYLDWWDYGWHPADDGKYPNEIEDALRQLL